MTVSADTQTTVVHYLAIGQRRIILCGGLGLCLFISVNFSAVHGPANIPYPDIARFLLRGLNFLVGQDLPQSDLLIVNSILLGSTFFLLLLRYKCPDFLLKETSA